MERIMARFSNFNSAIGSSDNGDTEEEEEENKFSDNDHYLSEDR